MRQDRRITLEELSGRGPIEVLRLLSFDPEIYLVEVELEEGRYLLAGAGNVVLSFRSQLAAKAPFKGMHIQRTVLRHQSSYDEMIGLAPEPGGNAMEMRIAAPDADPG